jgi:ribosome biogenesis GTPase A
MKSIIFNNLMRMNYLTSSSTTTTTMMMKNQFCVPRRLSSSSSSSSSSSKSSDTSQEKSPRRSNQIMGSDNACPGCGAALQSEHPHAAGYITVTPLVAPEQAAKVKRPNSVKQMHKAGIGELEHLQAQMAEEFGEEEMQALFSSTDPDSIWFNRDVPTSRKSDSERILRRVCQRCFALRNYGKLMPVQVPIEADVVNELLLPLRSQQVFVIQLIDLFDVGGTLIDDFHQYLGPSSRVFLVANKLDLMPAGIQPMRVTNWLKRYIKKRHPYLYKKVIGVALVSARSGAGVSEALRRIDIANSEKRDIFVVGCTNVGKSTFVNRVLRSDANSSRIADITVSRVHGTTLANIYAPYPRQAGVHLVDTPGLVSQKTIVANAGVEPSKRVRTVTVRLRRGKSVFFGGLTRIDYTEGEVDAVYLTLFAASECTVHVTNTDKASEVHAKHCGTLLRPPFLEQFGEEQRSDSFLERYRLEPSAFTLTSDSWRDSVADIVLPGVGWCAVNARHKFELVVHVMPGAVTYLRDPLMPYEMHDIVPMHKQK